MSDVRFGTAAGGFAGTGVCAGAGDSAGAVEAIESILTRPRDEVLAECRRYVVGQEDVLREVVGLTYSCLQRMEMRARGVDDLDLPRACAFMLSGTLETRISCPNSDKPNGALKDYVWGLSGRIVEFISK